MSSTARKKNGISALFTLDNGGFLYYIKVRDFMPSRTAHTIRKKELIHIVVLQTVAANLGSMLTPVGNPQNLYLYDAFNLSAGTFLHIMLPYGILSLICLILLTLLLPKDIAFPKPPNKPKPLFPMNLFNMLGCVVPIMFKCGCFSRSGSLVFLDTLKALNK